MQNIHMTFSQIDQRFLAKKDNLQTRSHVKQVQSTFRLDLL